MLCKALTVHEKPCKKQGKADGYCAHHAPRYKLARPEDCVICTEALSSQDKPLSCGHTFHKGCFKTWKKTKNSCPVCRTEFGVKRESEDVRIDLSSIAATEENINMISVLLSIATGLPEGLTRTILLQNMSI